MGGVLGGANARRGGEGAYIPRRCWEGGTAHDQGRRPGGGAASHSPRRRPGARELAGLCAAAVARQSRQPRRLREPILGSQGLRSRFVNLINQSCKELLLDHDKSRADRHGTMVSLRGAIKIAPWLDLEKATPSRSGLNRGEEWVAHMDESGRDAESEHFVLACVVGKATVLDRLSCEIRGLKRGLVPKSDPGAWELHGKEIWHGPDRKRGNSPLWLRNKEKKVGVLGAIVRAACDHDIAVFSVAINKEALRKTHEEPRVVEYAMTFLLERLERFFCARAKKETCRVVSDNIRAADKRRVEAAVTSLTNGDSTLSNIVIKHVSRIEYVDSLSSNNIQVVDVIAYIISHHMRKGKDLEPLFEQIESMIWGEGEWYGFRVF